MSSPKRSLVVVSNCSLKARLLAALAERNVPADGVEDSIAAQGLMAVRPYDSVIIDINVNDRGGPELLTELKRQPNRPHVLIMSPSTSPEVLIVLRSLGCDQVLTPPHDIEAVAVIVAEALGLLTPTVPIEKLSQQPDQPASISVTQANDSENHKPIAAVRLADDEKARDIASRLQEAGCIGLLVRTTDDLYSQLNRDRIDLLVIENDLPGFLSGIDVLEKLQRELIRPQTVLICDVRRSEAARVSALKPSRILPASSDRATIVETVRSLLAQRQSQTLCIHGCARKIVADHKGLRPMSQLIVKLTNYLSIELAEIQPQALARDIARDPQATAELLRFVNSAALGLRRRVTGVAEAVTILGARRAIVLILSRSALASSNDLISAWDEPTRTWFYRRSVLSAGAARAFARIEKVSAETAFLLGLLQDLGIAILADAVGERYQQVVERARTIPQLKLHNVEQVDLGFTHADVTAALLQKWELPVSLIEPVLCHHGDSAHLSRTAQAFVQVMRIGEALAELADRQCPQRRAVLNLLLSKYGPAEQAACPGAIAEAVTSAVEATQLLALPIPTPELLTQLDGLLKCTKDDEQLVVN